MRIKNFEDLNCWQEARSLVNQIYNVSKQGDFSKDFGLVAQIQRSAVSIMANISEGFDTFSDQEFLRFLRYAIRSCAEVRSHLYVALDVHYILPGEFEEISQQLTKCSNLTKALAKYLKDKNTPARRHPSTSLRAGSGTPAQS